MLESLFMYCCRPGSKASQIRIDGADDNQFVIGADAFSAQDAFTQISNNKRIGLFQGLVVGHWIQIRFTYAHLGSNPSQLTAIAFAANDAGFRMFGDHHAHDIAAMI